MKSPFSFLPLAVALLLPATAVRAEDAARANDDRPKLAVVVVSNLQNGKNAKSALDRLELAFREVASKRKWPVTILAEAFASNTPDHEMELRIYDQGLRNELPGELTFRGWMTLTVRGVKHDFGVITFRYTSRFSENTEDALDKIYLGAANAAADKIEPVLFPRRGAPQP